MQIHQHGMQHMSGTGSSGPSKNSSWLGWTCHCLRPWMAGSCVNWSMRILLNSSLMTPMISSGLIWSFYASANLLVSPTLQLLLPHLVQISSWLMPSSAAVIQQPTPHAITTITVSTSDQAGLEGTLGKASYSGYPIICFMILLIWELLYFQLVVPNPTTVVHAALQFPAIGWRQETEQATMVRSSCGNSCWSCWQTRNIGRSYTGLGMKGNSSWTIPKLWLSFGVSGRTNQPWITRSCLEHFAITMMVTWLPRCAFLTCALFCLFNLYLLHAVLFISRSMGRGLCTSLCVTCGCCWDTRLANSTNSYERVLRVLTCTRRYYHENSSKCSSSLSVYSHTLRM